MGYRNLLVIIIPLLVGSISGFFTRNAKEVFAALHKPAFAPSPSVFGPVWTVLYLLMGIALYRVVQSGKDIKTALMLFAAQLLLNFIWSPVFFVWQMRFLALVIILILLVVILLTAFSFYKVDKLAGILFIPYILWVSFAAVLTYALYQLNK